MGKPMRVLLVSHTCQSSVEGQPKAELLAAGGDLELTVLVPDRWKHYGTWRHTEAPKSPPGGPTYLVQHARWAWTGPGQWYLHHYPSLATILKKVQPDIIDLWEEPWGLVSAHACWLRNRLLPGAKIITETEQNIDKNLPPPFEQFRSFTLRNASFAIGRNSEAISVLRTKGFQGPAAVVPNGVDAALFRPLDRDGCRAKLGFRRFTAGYIGRLVEEKGLLDLVNALPFCPSEIDLVFLGSGPLLPVLQQRVGELLLTDRVRFLEARPLNELPEVMNAIDVLVLPSRTTGRWKEQFGRVLIEAHACGTPVIASNSGAIPEVVGAGGIIVEERNPKALGKALDQLACSPLECRRLGLAGREQTLAKYTWQKAAQAMREVYQRVLSEDIGSIQKEQAERSPV